MQKSEKLTGADYLLLMLYLNDRSPIKSAVRLTKMMFLFNEEIVPVLKKDGATINIDELPNFTAYNYGPFSKDVYEQIELFQNIGFIDVKDLNANEEMDEADDWEESAFYDEFPEEIEDTSRTNGKFMQYELLERGKEYVEQRIINKMSSKDKEQLSVLENYKRRIIGTSVKEILRYVYIKYPDMTKNSIIKKEVLGT